MLKKNVLIISISCVLILVIGLIVFNNSRNSSPGHDSQMFADRTQNVFNSLEAGDFQNAMKDFAPDARSKMTPQQLGQSWSQAIAVYGSLKNHPITYAGVDTDRVGMYAVYVTCNFEKGTAYGIVKFDRAKRIYLFRISDKPLR